MPRKKPSILTVEEPKTPVDVVVKDSNLPGKDGKKRHYGSIAHKRVTVGAILKEMEDNHGSVASKEIMFYVALELSRLMMEKFKRGYAVQLLDFGTIYPALKGSISTSDTPSKIKKHFTVGFTPSKSAIKALDNLVVKRVQNVPIQHYILNVFAVTGEKRPGNYIVKGMVARIVGKALKLGGSKCGLYAAEVSENWNGTLPDRKDWIELKHVCTNKPSTLDFFVEELTPGFYIIIIETSLSAGGKELKKSVIIKSHIVQVVPRDKEE